MAVAVPLVMMAAGAGTAAIVGTSLVLAATGINSKIDKAASKVFGKDLVTAANIGGAAFMAFGGGFPGAGAAEAGGEALSGMDLAADAGTAGANSIGQAASQFGGASAAGYMNGADLASNPIAPTQATTPQGALSSLAPAAPGTPGATPAAPGGNSPFSTVSNAVGNALDKTAAAFKGLSPQAQGALIQVGGGVLGGIGQAKEQQALMDAQHRYDQRYRSGSGVPYWSPASTYNRGG